jgi:aminomethyltransferase
MRPHQKALIESPFHPRLAALNADHSWVNWAGHAAPGTIDDAVMEYTAIRSQASLYDLTPMVKHRVAGPEAEAYLNRLTVRDVCKLAVGQVHYTCWCDDDGKVLDDGTVFRLGPDEFMICAQDRHLPWFKDSAFGFDVTVDDISGEVAALSLQGPCSYAVLKAAGLDVRDLKLFRLARYPHPKAGEVMISRTGFTGDLGYELWTTPERALSLWDVLVEAGHLYGLRVIGADALNMARLEAGFILPHLDFIPADQAVRVDRVRSPYEIGLGWLVDLDKGQFTGRRALVADPVGKRALVGLEVAGNVSAELSIIYHNKSREVGVVTGALWSPTLKKNIALADLERPYDAAKSDNLWVEIYALRELQYHKLMVKVKVVPRPFLVLERRRAFPPGKW